METTNLQFKDKWLIAYDKLSGEHKPVSPNILTSTVFNSDGVCLDDLLDFDPAEIKRQIREILAGAPEAYNTFLEVSNALDGNKNSITEILNEIDKRIKMPTENLEAGFVLKLDENKNVVFADDKDTVYEHPNKHKPWEIETDENNRFVSDEEKETWNNKLDATSDISDNKATIYYGEYTEEYTLSNLLSDLVCALNVLYDSKGRADGYASLDEKGKIPIDQLPAEALQDTTYDLSSYATSEDLKSYAKTDDLSSYAKSTDLEGLAKTTDLEDYQPKLSYTPEDAGKKGKANGYASLDANGQVPASQLPSYVDDVVEITDLPTTGEKGKIYVNTNTNQVFRWSGSQFISIVDFTAIENKINEKPNVVSVSAYDPEIHNVPNTLYIVE